jgi:hypothetical protein
MISPLFSRSALRASFVLGFAAVLAPAVHAGPPLICHPYTIGEAKSLPGGGKGSNWLGIDKTYDRKTLVADTLALLTKDASVIVRMETLRRASLYATSEMRGWGKEYPAEDRELALGLLGKLRERADTAPAAGKALALFDAGFFAETLRQTGMNPQVDGYALLTEAAKLRGPDAAFEFALALASTSPHRKEHSDHVAKARAGAKENPLLAQSVSAHFAKL